MIYSGKYDDFGNQRNVVQINLSSGKNNNRVIDFLETKDVVTKQIRYKICLHWLSNSKYHPDLVLSSTEMKELIDALTKMHHENNF